MIKIEDISYAIGAGTILSNINLAIPKGGITAIIGPNGAGKSTLVNLIARQIHPTSGQIFLDDLDIMATSPATLALRLALVAQHVGVASRLRISDLVRFGRWPHSNGRLTPQDLEVVEKSLELFALTDLKSRFLDELSGGQRQRAFLAMAYAQQTDWLLLDEPLNNLDMRHARSLMQRLKTMCRSEGKSVVMVVHDVNYAASWADHVIGMKDGKIAFSKNANDALSADNINGLFDCDIKMSEIDGQKFFLHHA